MNNPKNKSSIKASTFKRLMHYTKPHIGYLIIALIFSIISVASMLYVPIVTGNAIDFIDELYLEHSQGLTINFNDLIPFLIKIVISSIIYGITQWLMNLLTNIASNKTIQDIREDAFHKMLYVPLSYIDHNSHGDIISRIINDVDYISTGLLQGFTQLFTGIITIIGTILFMLFTNIALTIVVVVLTPLSLFVASFIAKHIHKMYEAQGKAMGELTGIIEEYVGNEKIVKTFHQEQKGIDKFKEVNNELKKWGVKAQIYSAYTNPCTRFVNGIVYAAVGVIGAIVIFYNKDSSVVQFNKVLNYILFKSSFTVGALTCFLSYANQYTKPFNEISNVVNELQNAFTGAGRVFKLIDEESEIDLGKQSLDANGKVSLQNVSFSYFDNQTLIENFNLNIHPGERVAIVGPTGCGKTTLINLLMRFYDVKKGQILVDDIDITNLKRSELRKNYGMVLQDTWLFTGTVRENIAYGKPDATLEEIIKASKLAHCHNFIEKLPQGYDTMVSDNEAISQGQKQLLCIARIMLMIPPMLILDEATSSIDTLTEIQIQDAFQTMMKGRTSFIIAHRLSTIKNADIILVMNNGNIIEQGTHQELLKMHGFYYQLYNSQFEE